MVKDGENRDKLVAGATKTTLTLAGAIATSHGHGDIAVMIALLKDNAPDAAVYMARYIQRECQARLPFLFKGAEATAHARLNEAVRSEDGAEALFEAYRNMMNTPEPFAAEALGRLAGVYIRDGKRPDQFFRATARVIEELGSEEYDGLQRIIAAAGTDGQQTYQEHIELSLNSQATSGAVEGGGAQVFYKKNSDTWLGLKDARGFVEKTRGMPRVFFLLRSHGLAGEVPGATTYNINIVSSDLISLDLGTIGKQLREVIAPRTSS